MASLLSFLKEDIVKATGSLTNNIRQRFGIGVPQPSSPAPVALPPPVLHTETLPPPTPATDAVRSKFEVPAVTPAPTPSPYQSEVSALATERAKNLEEESPFLKNLLGAAGGILHKGAMEAEDFVANQAKNVADFASGKLTLTPGDFVSGLAKVGKGILTGTGVVAQGFNQGILRIGLSIESALPGGKEALAKPQSPAFKSFTRSLTGRDETETYQQIFLGADQWARENGATPQGAKAFAGFAVLGSLFMDEPGIGPAGAAGKAAFRLTKDSFETLAKTEDETIIKNLIKTENPGISDKTLEFVTPLFKDAKTTKDVNDAVRLIQGAQKTAAQNAEKAGIIERAKVVEEPPVEEVLGRALETGEPQYIKAYRGYGENSTLSKDPTIAAARAKQVIDEGQIFNDGSDDLYVTRDYKEALRYANGKPENVVEFEVPITKDWKIDGEQGNLFLPTRDATYVPVRNARIAEGPVEKTVESASKSVENVNLVKELGVAKDPYQVLNILKNNFPNLPDRVIDRMAERFVRIKRVQGVEALVRAAKNLDDRFLAGEVKTGPKVEETFGRELTPKEQAAASAKRAAGERVSKSDAEVINETLPKEARKYLRPDQKIAYIRAIKDKFDDPKQAVASAQEYDRIWDDLNQHIIDEYEQLSLQKSFIEDTLAEDPAGQLYNRYYRRTKADTENITDELQEIMNRAQRKANEVGPRGGRPTLSKTEQAARALDTEIDTLGYEGFEAAQEAVERYKAMLGEAESLGDRLKELKPRVREAQILQEGLADIAIVPRKEVEAIDRLITPANFRDYFNDIAGFAGRWRDIYRNFEKFFGEKYPEIKKAVLDKFDDAKGSFVDETKHLADDLDQDIVKRFGFKRGSKESAAVQRYGDTGLPEGERWNYDKLVEEFGRDKANDIVAADAWFRKTYDRLIDELNVVRKKIYPNSPGKLIAKRKDYYRHFQELGDTWGDALREFFETPSGIDPKLVGLSEFTKAKSRFLPFAEERLGQETVIDAIGGFIDYVPAFSYAKHIDPQISAMRYLQRKLAEVAPRVGEEMKLPNGDVIKSPGAEGFVGFLDAFTRDLTGNTNAADRLTQYTLGRKLIRTGRFINNRIKANTVGGNLGSALAQLANVPAGIADTKLYAAKGLQRSLGSLAVPNEPMEKSIFLKERYAESLNERFPYQFKDRPFQATGDMARKQAGWIMRKADELGTRFIWNSEYEKYLGQKSELKDGERVWKKGASEEEAIRYADGRTRRIIAGRGIGEVPLGQKALRTQFIAPFTLEVGNAWWLMKDWVSERNISSFVTFFLANYLLNEAMERTRGSRVVFDPVNAAIDGVQSLTQEFKEGNYVRGGLKLLGRAAGEVLSNIPFGQTAAAIIPDSTVQKTTQALTGAPMDKQEIFGSSMVSGRFGTPIIVGVFNNGLKDAVYRLLPPVGGLQLAKTVSGITALLKGKAEDSKGKPTFEVPRTPANVARAITFGAGATSEARKYFDERQDLFERIDRQGSETFIRMANAEDDWANMKELVSKKKSAEALALWESIVAEDKLKAKAIAQIAKDEQKGLDGNDRLVKMLNVNNGERAKYIVEQMKKMTAKARAAYFADLVSKKIITNDVAKQIAVLLNP